MANIIQGVGNVIKGIGKKDKKDKKAKDDREWIQKAMDYYKEAKDGRGAIKERQMMVNLAWYKGLHNLKFDTLYNRFVWDDKDPIGFNVNKVYQTVRAVRGAVTKYDPTWSVDALPYGTLQNNEERMLGFFLQSEFEKLNMKHINKEVTMNGILHGIGIYQYGWDDYADDGDGEVYVECCDVFDTYIDPLSTKWDLSDCRYVIKIVRRSIDSLKKDKNYQNTDKLTSDGKMSSSEYKDKLLTSQAKNGNTENSALVYEVWSCEYEEKGKEDSEEKEESEPKKKIRVVTVCQDKLLRNEVTDLERLPFVIYESDTNANEIGGEGYVKNIVPINRALNSLEKSTLEYHALFAKGKWIVKGDADVKTITNQNGQIMRVGIAGNVEQVNLQSQAASVFNQIGDFNRYIEDIGGAQEALLGRAPAGVTAGIAFEQLVSNNMNVIAELVDNLEMSLSFLGEELLKLMYKHYSTTRMFRFNEGTMGKLGGAVVGQGKEVDTVVDESGVPQPAITLPELAKVKVRIVSAIGFTKAGKLETMFNLRKGGDISRKTLLENLDLDSDEEEQRIVAEQEAQKAQAPAQPPMPPMEQMPPTAEGMPMDQGMGQPMPEQVMPQGMPQVTPEQIEQLVASGDLTEEQANALLRQMQGGQMQ